MDIYVSYIASVTVTTPTNEEQIMHSINSRFLLRALWLIPVAAVAGKALGLLLN